MRKNIVKIAVIGLGYVGFPLYQELLLNLHKEHGYTIIGYDISDERIQELNILINNRNWIKKHSVNYSTFSTYYNFLIDNIYSSEEEKEQSKKEYEKVNPDNWKIDINLTSDSDKLSGSEVFIITVPTPITDNNKPDLKYIFSAINSILPHLNNDSVVIIESTISIKHYEQCKKIINEKTKHIVFSPERINPGDKIHNIRTIVKLIGAETDYGCKIAVSIYNKICNKIRIIESPKIAILSKLLENIQRDVNIALINEFAILCSKFDIDISDVLDAAKTKWNFLNFVPGFVNGHCIPTDPYYLLEEYDNNEKEFSLIQCGRNYNELYPKFVFRKFFSYLTEKYSIDEISKLSINILGYNSLKKDCNDSRNIKGQEFLFNLTNIFDDVTAFDINTNNVLFDELKPADILIILQDHSIFIDYINYKDKIYKLVKSGGYIVDIKNIINKNIINKYKLKKILC